MNLRDLACTWFPDGRAALLHPEDLSFHELNATGARVVAGLREGLPLPELVARLAAEWEAPLDEVDEAVRAFLDDLAAAGFPTT